MNHILEESQLVSLKGMDLSKVESKRSLGITDEAIAFGDVVGYSSGYLQTKIFLIGRCSPERAIVAFGKTCLEYDLQEILESITALNDGDLVVKLNELFQREKPSFGEGHVMLDEFGLPIVNITKADPEWLSKNLESGQKAILMCGTNNLDAKPVGIKGWGKYSNLSGLTIRYKLCEDSLQDDALKLRRYVEMCDAFMATPRDERDYPTLTKYIEHTFSHEEVSELHVLAKKYSVSRVSKTLPKQEAVTD